MKHQQLSNGLIDRLPANESSIVGAIPKWELAGKTGSIEGIMHECALLYVNRQCMAVTVLSKYCSEDAARQMIAQISSNVYMYARGEK